jgi:hypothetical protein
MRDFTRWDWFAVWLAIVVGLFSLLHWLRQRLPPNDPPNEDSSVP